MMFTLQVSAWNKPFPLAVNVSYNLGGDQIEEENYNTILLRIVASASIKSYRQGH